MIGNLKEEKLIITLEEYDIVKVYDKINQRELYVAVVSVKDTVAKVKLLNQPSYELHITKYADSIFAQHCHYDDEVYQQPLKFNKDRFTFEISESMWLPVSKDEEMKLIKNIINTNIDGFRASLIIHELDKLRFL